MSATEKEITRKALAGDRQALEVLWRRLRRWVAAILLAHRPRGADLEDLLQEVATTLVAKIQELRDVSRLRPWLRSVALNVARGAGRRARVSQRVERRSGAAALQVPDPGADWARQAADARSDLLQVLALLETLPAHYREPLMLRSLRGHSQKEIAELLGVPVTTVETRLARARRMLREKMGAKVTR